MTWLFFLTAAYLMLLLRVAYWIGGLLAEAELFLQRESACTCTRYRLCAKCLAELRGEQEAA